MLRKVYSFVRAYFFDRKTILRMESQDAQREYNLRLANDSLLAENNRLVAENLSLAKKLSGANVLVRDERLHLERERANTRQLEKKICSIELQGLGAFYEAEAKFQK